MISAEAKKGFDNLLKDSLSDSLQAENYGSWTIHNEKEENIKEKELYLLTVSSYHFRVFVILHFSKNTDTLRYVADALKTAPDKLADVKYYDYLGEIGNSFCGQFKRELGKIFPYLGMSTPNRMVGESLTHLSLWNYEHQSHWRARFADKLVFYGSMYISSTEDIDFKYEANLADDVETGALEMF